MRELVLFVNIMKILIVLLIVSGDVLEGVDRSEKYQRDAYTLRTMRADYELFNQQLCILGRNGLRIFRGYFSREE